MRLEVRGGHHTMQTGCHMASFLHRADVPMYGCPAPSESGLEWFALGCCSMCSCEVLMKKFSRHNRLIYDTSIKLNFSLLLVHEQMEDTSTFRLFDTKVNYFAVYDGHSGEK